MPIISIKYKFIVLMNPKCGSFFLKKNLIKFHDWTHYLPRHITANRLKYQHIEKEGLNWDDFTVISVVREPFSRIISSCKQNSHDGYKEINEYIKNGRIRHFYGFDMFHCDKDNKCLVDVIFDLKSIDDMISLLKSLNVPIRGFKLVKKKGDWKQNHLFNQTFQDINNKSKEILRNKFKYDFAFYENKLKYVKNKKIEIIN